MKRRVTFIARSQEFKRGTRFGPAVEITFVCDWPVGDATLRGSNVEIKMGFPLDTKEEDFQTIIPAVMYEDNPMMIKEFPRVKHKHFRVTIEEIDDDEVPA
jgi:hypothetical protein